MGKSEMQQQRKRTSLSEERIIKSAKKLFMEQGFSSVSVDQLCKEARVSKTTIYKYFGNMTGVLSAVVVDEGELFDLQASTDTATRAAFFEALVAYGTNLLKLLNRPFCIRLDRMLHEEARANPELAQAFYENAYGKSHDDITALIAHGQRKGFIVQTESAEDLADHLISMWEGLRFTRARLGLTNKPFESPEDWSAQCVKRLFPNSVN